MTRAMTATNGIRNPVMCEGIAEVDQSTITDSINPKQRCAGSPPFSSLPEPKLIGASPTLNPSTAATRNHTTFQ